MTHSIRPRNGKAPLPLLPRWFHRLARRLVLGKLSGLRYGVIRLFEDGAEHRFGSAETFPETAAINVRRSCFYSSVAYGGSVAAGEAYIQGDWECDDLTALTRILLHNREVLDNMDGGLGRLMAPFNRFLHWFNRNTLGGSRRNIQAHYDMGNDLFEQFLDESMMYSCAIFERSGCSLHEASLAKLDAVCEKLQLTADDHVIEIGSGWGGFALHAAGRYGCRVTTTTISRKQYDYVRDRIRRAGLTERVIVLYQDYRQLDGRYDKLVSIEMIEAVGYEHYQEFFRKCSSLLKADGVMLIQAITIADQRYEEASRQVDFIKRYIFPGGCLPSVTAMADVMTGHTDMRITHLEDIGPHYARTLKIWRERFHRNLDKIRALGYDERFRRMWEFYLCYCEGAFLERVIGDVQLLAVKPLSRHELPAAVKQLREQAA